MMILDLIRCENYQSLKPYIMYKLWEKKNKNINDLKRDALI